MAKLYRGQNLREESSAPEREGLRVVGGAKSAGRSLRYGVRLVPDFSKTRQHKEFRNYDFISVRST